MRHIGADVNLPKAGKYTFKVSAEGGGQKGNATFDYTGAFGNGGANVPANFSLTTTGAPPNGTAQDNPT